MTFEEYESELDRRIKELDWKQEKDDMAASEEDKPGQECDTGAV